LGSSCRQKHPKLHKEPQKDENGEDLPNMPIPDLTDAEREGIAAERRIHDWITGSAYYVRVPIGKPKTGS
jgi:hypothetical protein